MLDPAPQDIARLERNSSIQVLSRAEDRVMMIALDQYRDQTPYVSDLNGKPLNANPFKDVRVRQALSCRQPRGTCQKHHAGKSGYNQHNHF